ncbi:MAG: type II secretion system F family protein [Armatimonadota bacterium]|jgi:tight adherence protein B
MTVAAINPEYGLVTAIIAGWLVLGYVVWWVGDRVVTRRRKTLAMRSASAQRLTEEPAGVEESWFFDSIESVVFDNNLTRKLLVKLERAGLELKPSEFVGITGAISLALAITLALVLRFPGSQFVGLIVGVVGAWAYLESKCARRLAAFNSQLPDALSLIASALRSGTGFEHAALMVRDELPSPMSDEFARFLNETGVGLPFEDAMKRMVTRVQSYDLELAAVAMIVNRQVGGDLATILDNIGGMIRDRVRLEREVSALTVEGRMSGTILLVMPFVMAGLILTVNPGYLTVLLTDTIGKILMAGALVLQVLGIVIIREILKIDY